MSIITFIIDNIFELCMYVQVVRYAPTFYTELSDAAVTASMTKGAILRLILPYGEGTYSHDQSIVSGNSKRG